jgi:hypothetical protein
LGARQRLLAPRLDSSRAALRAFPNAQMIHLPVHPSRLNQVESYFSVVQRNLLTPDDFANLAEKITVFEKRYNHAAHPFDWRFGRDDLNRLLERIAA